MGISPEKYLKLTKKIIKASDSWKENKLVFRELLALKWVSSAAVSFTLLTAIFEGITVGLIASFLQIITSPDEPPIQTGIETFDTLILGTTASPEGRLIRLSIFIILIVWTKSLFAYASQFYALVTEARLSDRIRKRLYKQLQSLSLEFFSKTKSAELINTMTTEVVQVRQYFRALVALFSKACTLIAYVVSMVYLSWQLSILSIFLFSLLFAGVGNFIRRVREASFDIPRAGSQFASVVMEYISGIRTVHAIHSYKIEEEKFYHSAQYVEETLTKVASLSASVKPIVEGFASTTLVVAVIVVFIFSSVENSFNAASLLTFMFVLFRMMPLISQANVARTQIGQYQGSMINIDRLLSTEDKPYLTNGWKTFEKIKNSIDLVSVSFAYEPNKMVIYDANLTLKQGETTAIVGASGAGKSTLVDLIARFYDPTEGTILIDGSNIKCFDLASLRRQMGIVSQDTFIFNATVRENIAYGFQEISEEEIVEAAKQANALSFINDLPEGFETILGDRGTRLSGGQRQRIAIARMILRKPQIIILDEATSALDSVTENLIQQSLERVSRGRTVIVIAHRLSTIMKADKVVVLERGRIIEVGKYDELISQKGVLWRYHKAQFERGKEVNEFLV